MRRILGAAVLGAAIALERRSGRSRRGKREARHPGRSGATTSGGSTPAPITAAGWAIETPNFSSVANGGMMFINADGQQSCTAGRSAFITGQSPLRHRPAAKVGLPGARKAVRRGSDDRGAAEAAGLCDRPVRQKSSGDRDEHLPTNHGFDELLGNLYPPECRGGAEHPDYPQDPESRRSSVRAA